MKQISTKQWIKAIDETIKRKRENHIIVDNDYCPLCRLVTPYNCKNCIITQRSNFPTCILYLYQEEIRKDIEQVIERLIALRNALEMEV